MTTQIGPDGQRHDTADLGSVTEDKRQLVFVHGTPGANKVPVWNATTKRLEFKAVAGAGAQGAAIANATDAASTMARLNDLLAFLRTRGDIAP